MVDATDIAVFCTAAQLANVVSRTCLEIVVVLLHRDDNDPQDGIRLTKYKILDKKSAHIDAITLGCTFAGGFYALDLVKK